VAGLVEHLLVVDADLVVRYRDRGSPPTVSAIQQRHRVSGRARASEEVDYEGILLVPNDRFERVADGIDRLREVERPPAAEDRYFASKILRERSVTFCGLRQQLGQARHAWSSRAARSAGVLTSWQTVLARVRSVFLSSTADPDASSYPRTEISLDSIFERTPVGT